MNRAFMLVILSVISACAGPSLSPATPQARKAIFDEAEYAPFAENGTGTVQGQAFLKTRGGDVKYGAGCTIYVGPMTSYGKEFYKRCVIEETILEQPDPRALKYLRQAVGDGEGRFRITGLPPGDYYAACSIIWEVPGRYAATPTGGWAHATFSIGDGETKDILLTR